MIFAAPWVLLALPALPLLWWLLRITPPTPRVQTFPAVRLLLGLKATEETPARTPWWLLALRMAAGGLIILGLARPVLDAGAALSGSGPLLLVIDDGWASAADWGQRIQAAATALERAERAGRSVALLATAADDTGAAPRPTAIMPVPELRARLAALRPKPWPPDRRQAAAALRQWEQRPDPRGSILYIADGLAGPDWAAFATSLGRAPIVLRDPRLAHLLLPPTAEADRLVIHAARPPSADPVADIAILAQSGDGRTLARITAAFGPDGRANAPLALPPELRNRLSRLVVEGPPSAGGVFLLDERFRRRPVGLLAGDATTAGTPLTGQLFYLRRALDPFVELRDGDLATLLSRDLSVLVLADRVVPDGPEADALAAWVDKGGLLVRFAGPQTAEHPDSLLPVRLLAGDRQLGGAMSWSQPAGLAEFAAGTPFAGLAVPADVRITRQVLAEPAAQLATQSWARLADGTPLVTQATRGAGRVVLFHVTANADWSDLALSGLFVDMMRRLVALSAGVRGTDDAAGERLAPVETLDGFGQPGRPPPAATALSAAELARITVSPRQPPGLYGPDSNRRALNLSAGLPALQAAPAIAGASEQPIAGGAPETALAPWLLAAALFLLALDTLLSLRLRGLLRATAAALVLLCAFWSAQAAAQPAAPALTTRLAYVLTGDAQTDATSRAGLAGLSDYVNRRTNAALGEPMAVTPGEDDLSTSVLLYWPILAEAPAASGAATAALNTYMASGGIILIDTRSGGSGEGFGPGADAALARLGRGLAVPPLTQLTSQHVLARSFYLLQDFPGRYTGDTVWVQREQDRANDSVSPVIIGANDWAAAWAVDAQGQNPYATIPGGARQRTIAYRFGVNLVMYAFTGNYKGDQVHVPAILERLGQ